MRRTSPTSQTETASLDAVTRVETHETTAPDEHQAPWPTRRGLPPVIGQFDASAYDVAKHMDVAAIPDDIRTFLTEMAALV